MRAVEIKAKRGLRSLLMCLMSVLVVACATKSDKSQQYVVQEDWMQAVVEIRKAYSHNPGDPGIKSRLQQIELKAADYFYQQGLRFLNEGNIDAAIGQYQQGLVAMPEHSKLTQSMKKALLQKEANVFYQEARRNQRAGRTAEAISAYEKALKIFPDFEAAYKALEVLLLSRESSLSDKISLKSDKPISLNFRRTDIRTAFEFLAESFGVNIIFDDAVKSVPVTLFAKNVTFQQALNLLLTTTKTFYQQIGRNTILIAPDTKDKRGQYEDQIVKVFHLQNLSPKEMSNIIKGILTPKKMVTNEQLNTLIVRDTEEILHLVQQIIDINDLRPAEVILDVEILEVNRTKSEQLGLDFGSSIKVDFDSVVGDINFGKVFSTGTITASPVTFRYFKQDVDAKTLANPKVRVLSEKPAKIHIGDRVPLRSSTIQDATGQTRTTFQYTDIGIKLDVEPAIHYDNSVTVSLKLEVSTLGQNLGTPLEPAFSIGTRNAETFMLLRDGETAILGGLIRDEERNNRVKLPAIGDIPILGSLFTSYDDSVSRTDVLLTITPRVVRAWDLPTKAKQAFYSGTDTRYSSQPIFAALNRDTSQNQASTIAMGDESSGQIAKTSFDNSANQAKQGSAPHRPQQGNQVPGEQPEALHEKAILSFGQEHLEVTAGEEFTLALTGQYIENVTKLPLQILFNPRLLSLNEGKLANVEADNFKADLVSGKGVIEVELNKESGINIDQSTVFAQLKMTAVQPGVSYIVFKAPALQTLGGEVVNPQVKAIRVVIK